MKNYKIKLKSAGSITQPADSQKIFGALVTAFSKRKGAEEASELVKTVIDKKVHIALSNVLPLDYLPMPQNYIMEKIVEKMSDEEKLKTLRKELKKRTYIKECDLKDILDDPKKGFSICPYIH